MPLDPETVLELIEDLPPEQADVVRLFFIEGLTRDEIALQLGRSRHQVDEIFHHNLRAITRFASLIEMARSDDVQLIVAWDPGLLSEDQYARLVVALGDLVRSEGGIGVERVRSQGISVGIPTDAGVPR